MKPAPPVTRTCLDIAAEHTPECRGHSVARSLGCSVARLSGTAATQEPSNSATMILVTGAAGFIGYHVTKRLLERGEAVVGIDNLNPYYDPKLKEARLQQFRAFDRFEFVRLAPAERAPM